MPCASVFFPTLIYIALCVRSHISKGNHSPSNSWPLSTSTVPCAPDFFPALIINCSTCLLLRYTQFAFRSLNAEPFLTTFNAPRVHSYLFITFFNLPPGPRALLLQHSHISYAHIDIQKSRHCPVQYLPPHTQRPHLAQLSSLDIGQIPISYNLGPCIVHGVTFWACACDSPG